MKSFQEKIGAVFEGQWMHYVFLALAAAVSYQFFVADSALLAGSLFGLSTFSWFIIGSVLAVLHHTYVWFVWRTQMHFSLSARVLGQHAFTTTR